MENIGLIASVTLSVIIAVLVIGFLPEIGRAMWRVVRVISSSVLPLTGWVALMALLFTASGTAAVLLALPKSQPEELLIIFFTASLFWLCTQGLGDVGGGVWRIVNPKKRVAEGDS